MKKIIITSLTKTGETAIKEDVKEDMTKMRGIHKAMFNTMYSRELITDKIVTLIITCKKSNLNSNPYFMDSIKHVIETSLKNFGAIINKDYIIEVKEG